MTVDVATSPAPADDLGARRAASRSPPATVGSSAPTRDAARDVLGIGRGLQHEVTRAPIVDPDRRAIGAEQTVGAVAEDVEAGRPGSASPTRLARIRRSSARRSRCSSSRLPQAEQLERGHEGVGRPRAASRRPSDRRRARRSRSPAGPRRSSPLRERQQQRRRACRAAPPGRASAGRRRRRAWASRARSASDDERRLRAAPAARARSRSASRPKPDVACSAPLRGLCSNSSEQRAAGHVERVLVQLRQQIVERGVAPARAAISSGVRAVAAAPCPDAAPAVERFGVAGCRGVSGHAVGGQRFAETRQRCSIASRSVATTADVATRLNMQDRL